MRRWPPPMGGPVLLTPSVGAEQRREGRDTSVWRRPSVFCVGLSDAVAAAVQAAVPGASVDHHPRRRRERLRHELQSGAGSGRQGRGHERRHGHHHPGDAVPRRHRGVCLWPALRSGRCCSTTTSSGTPERERGRGSRRNWASPRCSRSAPTWPCPPASPDSPTSPATTATRPTATWPSGLWPTPASASPTLGIATGDKFPDALAAGPYLAPDGGHPAAQPACGPAAAGHQRPHQPPTRPAVQSLTLLRHDRTGGRTGQGATAVATGHPSLNDRRARSV